MAPWSQLNYQCELVAAFNGNRAGYARIFFCPRWQLSDLNGPFSQLHIRSFERQIAMQLHIRNRNFFQQSAT
jgi:hypothetical protein